MELFPSQTVASRDVVPFPGITHGVICFVFRFSLLTAQLKTAAYLATHQLTGGF